jgi:riboflavin synthase
LAGRRRGKHAGVFTGLVEDVGRVGRVDAAADGGSRVLELVPERIPTAELAIGDSVAVDGVCLTVTARSERSFTVLAGEETLRRTALGDLAAGRAVHLERALRLGDRLGGHLVQGHVDGVGQLVGRRADGASLVLEVSAPADLLRYVVEKGSITLDGVSLTVVSVTEFVFTVALIPHTVAVTALGDRQVGARLNLEVDMIAKYVERLLGAYPASPRVP